MFEIEKRTLFNSRERFEKFKLKINKLWNFINKDVYKTFLFNTPEFIRIRLTLNKNTVEITKKIWTYNDAARKEINKYIKINQIDEYIKKLESQWFNKCLSIKTEREIYKYNGLTITINDIEFLGMIVEIEGLTEDKTEILDIEKKVIKTMQELNITELDPNIYQKMMNKMYIKLIKPISEQEFKI